MHSITLPHVRELKMYNTCIRCIVFLYTSTVRMYCILFIESSHFEREYF